MRDPLLYEINTRCWLRGLSEKAAHSITLADVPEPEFAEWQRLGFTHIWLMGAWTSGPRARAEALKHDLGDADEILGFLVMMEYDQLPRRTE